MKKKYSGTIFDFINEVEYRFEVGQWRTEQYALWPILRSYILWAFRSPVPYESMFGKPAGYREALDKLRMIAFVYTENIRFAKSDLFGRIKRLTAYANECHSYEKIPQCDFIIFSSTRNHVVINGRLYDKITDPVVNAINSMGYSHVTLQTSIGYCNINSFSISRKVIDITEGLLQYRTLYYRDARVSFNDAFNNDCEAFLGFCKEIAVSPQTVMRLSRSRILAYVRSLQVIIDYFLSVITSPNIKACFLSGYSGEIARGLTIACKIKNISVIDLQHGVMSEEHPAFGRWNRVPRDGFEMLPDEFWVWSDLEKQIIDKWSLPQGQYHRAVVTGHSWRNYLIRQNLLGSGYSEYLAMIRADKRRKVIFTLQPAHGVDVDQIIPDYIIQAVNSTYQEWNWCFRLHPGMAGELSFWRNHLISRCGEGRFEIDDSSKLPLEIVLSNMDIHITRFSTVVLDCRLMGIPSIITDCNGEKYFKPILDEGTSIYSENLSIPFEICVNNLFLRSFDKRHLNKDGLLPAIMKLIVDFDISQLKSERSSLC